MHEQLVAARDEVDVERDAGIALRDETDLEPTLEHRGRSTSGYSPTYAASSASDRETRDGDVVSRDTRGAAEVDGFYLPEHHFSSPRSPATDLQR